MRAKALLLLLLVPGALVAWPGTSQAAEQPCRRFVLFTMPAVTWEMVEEFRPPTLLRVAEEGAIGAMAVRTNSSRTSYASGFTTLGAGTRTDGGRTAGALASGIPTSGPPVGRFQHDAVAGGFAEIVAAAAEADYVSEPGALAGAMESPLFAVGNADLGLPPPTPFGYGRWPLLATSHPDGTTTVAAVGEDLLVEDATAPFGVRTDQAAIADAVTGLLADPCTSLVVDQGDLIRADTGGLFMAEPDNEIMRDALLAADETLGVVEAQLDADDLLVVVSPTSPWWDEKVHLGVAVAKGPGFSPGSALQSASTRQTPLVTLPDVAPTLLGHLGVERPASMIGRPFVEVDGGEQTIASLVQLDRESVFAHGFQAGISTGFVVFQIAIYATAILLLTRRERRPAGERRDRLVTWLRHASLAIVAFPFSTYLATPLPAHKMGTVPFIATLIAIDVIVVVIVSSLLKDPLERLLAITGSTILLFIIDLSLLQQLQLNAVWGNDPIVAGRFTGLGNIAFAILGSSSLMTGALLVHRWGETRRLFLLIAALFVATVVVDGAPSLGSDVGGVLALVPALGITFMLLMGKRPTVRTVLIALGATVAALAAFLILDFARPADSRTHLARLVEDIRARGFDAFGEAASRKIRTNLRVFRSTIWTYLVPPALAVITWLLLRPSGRWHELAVRYPKLRAGLIGGLVLAVLGFAVNDSGIVVPAMVLSFLAPMSLLIHLLLEHHHSTGEAPS